jgi:hypothetical protein
MNKFSKASEIEISYLKDCFQCSENGVLTWKSRPTSHFGSIKESRRWNTRYSGMIFTRKNTYGYISVTINYLEIAVHKVVFALNAGKWPSYQIDHIDGDRTNNAFSNLRDVSQFENAKNRKGNSNNTSGVCGVSFSKSVQRWQAYISVSRKRIHLGFFEKMDGAVTARNIALQKHKFSPRHGHTHGHKE